MFPEVYAYLRKMRTLDSLGEWRDEGGKKKQEETTQAWNSTALLTVIKAVRQLDAPLCPRSNPSCLT